MPPPRPTDAEFSAYSNRTPPALPTMITGVGANNAQTPSGIMAFAPTNGFTPSIASAAAAENPAPQQAASRAVQAAPLSSEDALSRLESLESSNAPKAQIDAASAALKEAYRREVDAMPSISDLAKNGTPVRTENFGVSNSPASTPVPPASIPEAPAGKPDSNAVTSPSLIDRGIKAFPGAAIDLGFGALGLPFYGPLAFGMKLAGMETPGSMLGNEPVRGMPIVRRAHSWRSPDDHRIKSVERLVVLRRLVVQVAGVPLPVVAAAPCSLLLQCHDLRQPPLCLVAVSEPNQVLAVRQVLPAREVGFDRDPPVVSEPLREDALESPRQHLVVVAVDDQNVGRCAISRAFDDSQQAIAADLNHLLEPSVTLKGCAAGSRSARRVKVKKIAEECDGAALRRVRVASVKELPRDVRHSPCCNP